ncbi:MAG: M56 family metallopeptidase [Pseudomonadales bacterium]|nr:M56 family metallopeptidase [Pseudomonadales bacterium]
MSPITRHLLWLNMLVCLLLIPFLTPASSTTVEQTETASAYEMVTLSFASLEVPELEENAADVSMDLQFWRTVGISGYFIICAAFLAQILIAAIKIHRINQHATPIADLAFVRKINKKRQQLNISRPVIVKFSDEISSPVSFGLFKPVVIFPLIAKGWTERAFTSALAHEMSHIARLDWLSTSGGYLFCSLLWINPFAWYALSRLKVEAESASDIGVLHSGIANKDYAEDLLSITRSCKLATDQQLLTQNMLSAQLLKSRVALLLDFPSNSAKTSSLVPPAIVLISAVLVVWLCAGTFLRASLVEAFNWEKYEFDMKLSEEAFSHKSPFRTRDSNLLAPAESALPSSYSLPEPIPEINNLADIGQLSKPPHLLSTNASKSLEASTHNLEIVREQDYAFDLGLPVTDESLIPETSLQPAIAGNSTDDSAGSVEASEIGYTSVLADLSKSELFREIRKVEAEYFSLFNASEKDKSLHVLCGTYRPKGSFIPRHFCEPRFVIEARSAIVGRYSNVATVISYPSMYENTNHIRMRDLTAALNRVLNENQELRDLHIYLRQLKSAI